MDNIIKSLPEPENPDDFLYWYKATDLELVNYWLSSADGDDSGTQFINFSSDFKKRFDYQNYSCSVYDGMGESSAFRTAIGGEGLFKKNGVVYGVKSIGVRADHILYVSSDTPNNIDAKKEAVQKKLNTFMGNDDAKVEESTVKEAILYSNWNSSKVYILQEYPDATWEKYLNGELEHWQPTLMLSPDDPEYADYMEYITGLVETDACFKVKIGNLNHYFLVECNSDKIVEAPKYQGKDAATNISITTDSTSIPLDTEIMVEKLTSGEEYDRIIKALNVKENSTYDIKLYSQSAQKYITKLESGKFEVKLPVPKELEGKELGVYYVDAENKITYHKVTVTEGFAIFETDHFSVYVLSEVIQLSNRQDGSEISQPAANPDETEKSPATGNNNMVIPLLFAVFVMGVFSIKKIKA